MVGKARLEQLNLKMWQARPKQNDKPFGGFWSALPQSQDYLLESGFSHHTLFINDYQS